ncbi:hypothetical protein CISIN_1g033338mg [Citrus sinensis]|uniref:DUF7887 domain-containing protein n=1 Tax=Citrus sinensis TaxID=2711 RepID=A0A067F4P1_CITSI|nr:hypothetical protein CISIN_1g033338mg [Citrus sinensis]
MLVTEKCFSFRNLTPYLPVKKHAVGSNCISFITLAKKKDLPETSSAQQQNEKPIFPIKVSNLILSRAAVAVLGLGFIDAGGDWSRIGVISEETEALLKVAAFGVVPLCIFFIFSFYEESQA